MWYGCSPEICKVSEVVVRVLVEVLWSIILTRYHLIMPLRVAGGCQVMEMEREEVAVTIALRGTDGAKTKKTLVSKALPT